MRELVGGGLAGVAAAVGRGAGFGLGFGLGVGFCVELADGVLNRKRRAEGFWGGIVGVWWHERGGDGARGMGRRDGGAGVGRIAETRWRGVTGSSSSCTR
jgi:hypothetical protein